MVEKVLVIGAGGWGTALARVLDERGVDVVLWSYDEEEATEIARTRRNARYLPGVGLSERIRVTHVPSDGADCPTILSVVPSKFLRSVLERFRGVLDGRGLFVSATKGIEHESLRRPSELLAELVADGPVVALSGPSHAEEVGRGMPTTVVAACTDSGRALRVQDLLTTDRFRVYTNNDPVGVELGGCIKNVISIAGGIVDGLGFGDNTKAALLTRGLVEMVRLGTALGASRETFFGLAGVGDLITSCISPHGRNRRVGERIGRGERLEDIVASMRQVAEGVLTAEAIHRIFTEHQVEMPICEQVYQVLYHGKDPAQAVRDLMSRQLKDERSW